MNAELTAAFNHLYEVFALYEDFYGFAKHSGVSRSLRELTREDWSAMDAKFDMGVQMFSDDLTLFRHFLPRFLEWELAPTGVGSLESWEVSYRLDHAHWLGWPAAEVEALRTIFEAWTRELLINPDTQAPMGFLTEIKEDPTFHLETWLQARPYELAEWLWRLDQEHHENALQWAISPHVEAALEAEFFRNPDGERARVLSRSIELIRSLRG